MSDINSFCKGSLLPIAGDIYRQAARFTSSTDAKASTGEELKFWKRMTCLAFEILGESTEHWTVLFRGGASIWVSEGFVSSFEAAAAVVRCGAQLYSFDNGGYPSDMTQKAVLTSLDVLFDLLPKIENATEEGRRSSVQVTGEYTVLMYAARVLLLQYLHLRNEQDDLSDTNENDFVTKKMALLVPDYCERACVVTLLYKLPSTLPLVWSTLSAVLLGDLNSELSGAGRKCLLHFFRILGSRGDSMLVQLKLRMAEVWYFVFTNAALPKWSVSTLNIDSEPAPWSKTVFADLVKNLSDLGKR